MSERCGNPLFRDWVKEWMDDARAMNQKSYYTYKKAYDSLCKCPVSFSHPSEAITLNGIGDGIIKRLEECLIKHCEENGLPIPYSTKAGSKRARRALENLEEGGEGSGNTRVRKKTTRTYVPVKRSGAYGILLCLLDFRDQGIENISQTQITREGQKYTDKSFTRADAGTSYTAWSSISTLLKHGYVYKNGSPPRYSLTETGVAIAEHTRNVENGVVGARAPRLDNSDNDGDDNSGRSAWDALINNENLDDILAPDLSLYVLDPSKHKSITVNGVTRNYDGRSTPSSQITTSSSSNNRSNSNNNNSNSNLNRSNNNNSSSNNSNSSRRPRQKKRDLLDEFDGFGDTDTDNLLGLDLSLYVQDPSKYSSISLNGRTRTYDRPETSISTVNTTTNGNTLGSEPNPSSFSFSDDDFELDLSQPTRDTRASSVGTDVIEILSPPTQASTSSLNNTSRPFPLSSSTSSLLQQQQKRYLELSSQLSVPDDTSDFFPLSQARSNTIKEDTFHYTYVDKEGNPTRHFSGAAVAINEVEKCLMYRIRFFTKQRQHEKALPMRDVEVDPEDRDYAYGNVKETDIVDAVCPGLPATLVLQLHNHQNESDDFWPPENSQSRLDVVRKKNNRTTTAATTTNSSSQPTMISSQTSISSSQNILSQPKTITAVNSDRTMPSSQTSVTNSQVPVSQLISESEATLEIAHYLPDEYEIVLVLDNREIQMQKDRQYFQRMLTEKGVNVITRALELGDVIWIARKKTSDRPEDELFLDFIVERKRLDDLVTSIKDGRFNEQKGRLKRSGSQKIMYIVEEYDRESAVANIGAQAIQTAMSSTQVVDGVFLKRTNSVEETIEYLVLLTKSIEKIYQNTILCPIPEHIITRQNYVQLKETYRKRDKESERGIAHLINYPMYRMLNKKAGSTSVHDLYMRMLMIVRGINAERALTLMKVYPTPSALLQSFAGKTPEQAKSMAKDATKNQIARRRWSSSASAMLYEIWGATEYEDEEDDGDDDDNNNNNSF